MYIAREQLPTSYTFPVISRPESETSSNQQTENCKLSLGAVCVCVLCVPRRIDLFHGSKNNAKESRNIRIVVIIVLRCTPSAHKRRLCAFFLFSSFWLLIAWLLGNFCCSCRFEWVFFSVRCRAQFPIHGAFLGQHNVLLQQHGCRRSNSNSGRSKSSRTNIHMH